jgi:predicted helicase
VENHLIPRLHGFEILMASYAMAHLKIDMLLQETGFKPTKNQRLKIYLTNSLEEYHEDDRTLFALARWLSEEAQQANDVKRDTPVMVIMGNPPYAVSSSNKSDWIQNLVADYKKDLNERKINLDDDYIKFTRFGQHFIDKTGEGILAYISNNSFIDGLTHRQMRKHLLESFDKIYILDLHGSAKKKEVSPDGSVDQNVFDIMQGVSINLFVKTNKKKKKELAKVFHYDLFGKRELKYDFLNENSVKKIKWNNLDYAESNYFFVKKDFDLSEVYEKGISLDELFIQKSSGVETRKDSLIIYTGHTKGINGYPMFNNFKHFLDVNNIGLTYERQCVIGDFTNIFFSNTIVDGHILGTAFSKGYTAPLYLYPDSANPELAGIEKRKPNLKMEIVNEITGKLKLTFTEERETTNNSFSPIDILDYIYAVLHSPTYRETYKEFLKIDFPRVPYPEDKKTFWKLIKLGEELRQIHLLESDVVNTYKTSYPVSGNNIVDKIKFDNGNVYINETQYFSKVPEVAWNFYIGGYQPAQKWLKDRKERVLGFEDIKHYQKIIVALVETDRIMKEIDKIERIEK